LRTGPTPAASPRELQVLLAWSRKTSFAPIRHVDFVRHRAAVLLPILAQALARTRCADIDSDQQRGSADPKHHAAQVRSALVRIVIADLLECYALDIAKPFARDAFRPLTELLVAHAVTASDATDDTARGKWPDKERSENGQAHVSSHLPSHRTPR